MIYRSDMPGSIKFAVTTALSQTKDMVLKARQIACTLGVAYVERNGRSLKLITESLGMAGLIVVSAQRVSFVSGAGEFYFHPGLAGLRINELKYGKTDQMIVAMSIGPGSTVLDCTLGLGSDAVVASFIVGENGRVVGLEGSPVIAYLVKTGLSAYPEPSEDIAAAMRRIEVVRAEHHDYLQALPPGSFDVVYFDPMFRIPRRRSPAMNAMRALACPEPLKRETINLAIKVAAKRVVIKERRGSEEFIRLGVEKIFGGRYAPVVYGLINGQGLRYE